QRRDVVLPAEARHACRAQLGNPLDHAADGSWLGGGDGVEGGIGDRLDETEAEQRRRLALGGTVRAARKRPAGGIADLEGGGEGGAGRLFVLAGGREAVRRCDLAPERGRLDAVREDGERSLRLRSQAQDVVAREDVERSAGRVVPDADLVDRPA